MKRRLMSLLLALGLLCSGLPTVFAQDGSGLPAAPAPEEPAVTALCVAPPGQGVLLDWAELALLCRQATGHELESVTFSPLSPAVGKLTLSGKPLTPDTVCHTRYTPLLSKVCFTPYTYGASQFTGQGEVAFTMTSEREETVSGVLILYVPEPTEPPEEPTSARRVTAVAGKSVDLCDHLPRPISQDSATLTVTLPSSQEGYLWLDYDYPQLRRKLLPGETLYSDQAPNYHSLTFVPADGEERDVRLEYLFSSGKVKKQPGALELSLREPKEPPRPSPAAPEPDPITITTQTTPADLSVPLQEACRSRGLGSLKSVLFDSLPLPEEGTVFYQNTPTALGESYPCAQELPGYRTGPLTFVPGGEFQHSVTLRYVATDSLDHTYSGYLTLTPGYPSQLSFRDMAGWEWAMSAAQFLGQNGYLSGETAFAPGENATRMDLIHALALTAYSNSRRTAPPAPGFSDLPDDPELLKSVAALASRGVAQGNGSGLLLPDEPVTRQDALVLLHRAMVDRGKNLPLYGDLSAFSDAGDVAPYAQEAVTLLAARGVVLGDGAGKLDPLSPITRAEMACLLYRAFG